MFHEYFLNDVFLRVFLETMPFDVPASFPVDFLYLEELEELFRNFTFLAEDFLELERLEYGIGTDFDTLGVEHTLGKLPANDILVIVRIKNKTNRFLFTFCSLSFFKIIATPELNCQSQKK